MPYLEACSIMKELTLAGMANFDHLVRRWRISSGEREALVAFQREIELIWYVWAGSFRTVVNSLRRECLWI